MTGRTKTTKAGARLVRALEEVLADVRNEKPPAVVARVPPRVDVKRVRRKMGLSQAAFAARFGINRKTLQDWEQGRFRPEPMARALLTIIEREPEAARRALAAE